uniref:Translation initiation factor eIF2 assembly protein n=1 Tax=Nothobranchius rachovii TaxID=451742 RepID=A0A1A8RYA0_9TELE
MKKEQVANCQFSVWYPIFKKHTIKSQILPLPQNVIDYLLDDGTLVVSGSDHSTQPTHTNSYNSDAEEDVQWSDDETTTTVTAPEFPEFTSKPQFLQCSDQDSPDPVISYELVLRKWSELIPGGEFRCFVKENKLIAISQRDYTQYYQHILTQEQNISHAIQDFFSQHIQYHFLDEDFVFDVYRDSQGRVWLIDLNPFGEVTDSLLFRWDELMSGGEAAQQLQQDGPAFRYTMSEVTVQPSPCLSYRIPRDFVDLSTGEDAYKLIDFLKLKKNQQEESEEEEEGNAPP